MEYTPKEFWIWFREFNLTETAIMFRILSQSSESGVSISRKKIPKKKNNDDNSIEKTTTINTVFNIEKENVVNKQLTEFLQN